MVNHRQFVTFDQLDFCKIEVADLDGFFSVFRINQYRQNNL